MTSTGNKLPAEQKTSEGYNKSLYPSPPSQDNMTWCDRMFAGKSDVRVSVDIGGETWFVADDICKILGYKNTAKEIHEHCSANIKKIMLDTAKGPQAYIAIGEPDLYRLIIRSKMPEAVEFERWVMEDVLPSLRKTGRYKVTRKLDYTPDPAAAEAAEAPAAQVELFPRLLQSVSFPKPLTDKLNAAKTRLAEEGHTFPSNKDYLTYLIIKALETIQ